MAPGPALARLPPATHGGWCNRKHGGFWSRKSGFESCPPSNPMANSRLGLGRGGLIVPPALRSDKLRRYGESLLRLAAGGFLVGSGNPLKFKPSRRRVQGIVPAARPELLKLPTGMVGTIRSISRLRDRLVTPHGSKVRIGASFQSE